MDDFETIRYAAEDGVAVLTLHRPASLNALNARMADEMLTVLDRVRDSPDIRCLVVRGAGGAFCAGGDVRDTASAGARSAEQASRVMARYHRLVLALHGLDRPVIAAADGVAFGAGFSLLLLADIVLLSEKARLCMAFQRIGLVPDCGALFTLPRSVGLQRAKELMFSAREIGADEACTMGLALEVWPAAELMSRAMQMARSFCGASGTALSMTKRALHASQQSDLQTMLALEAAYQSTALSGDYPVEAARRFAARETPQFKWPANRRSLP